MTEAFSGEAIKAFDAFAHAVQRYVDEAAERERRSTGDFFRQMNEERKAHDPFKRLDELESRRKTIEAKRDGRVDRVAAIVGEQWETELAYITYEEELVNHEGSHPDINVPHPGKPPKGYKPITGPVALKARRAHA